IRPPEQPAPNRWAAFFLLLIGGGLMFVNLLALAINRGGFALNEWLPLIVWIICAAAGSRLIARRLPGHDRLLYPLALFMTGWGLVLIERLAPPFAERQTL